LVSKILSFGLDGADGYIVTVEAFLSGGLPSFDVVGLPDAAVRESRDRVRASIKNLKADFPKNKITINLAPAGTKKEGPIYDLPILLGMLVSSEQLPEISSDCAFLGELSLNGELRAARGVLSYALAAKKNGIKKLFVPAENAKEASLAGEELEVYGISTVSELVSFFKGELSLSREPVWTPSKNARKVLDFADVKGQENVKRALEIAAAGGHNVLMIGPPGSGKSMLSERIPSILPDMTYDEALCSTGLHSIRGLVSNESPLLTERPFRSPHHTSTTVALSGGGASLLPGELSLSHNGVLFLDELPEFHRDTLEILRQPMETGEISIARAAGSVTYPARFMLVCAMNPCKCGWRGYESEAHACSCTDKSVKSYMGKISGPLLDRIDIHVSVPGVTYSDMSGEATGESSAEIKKRVEAARERARRRGISCNAHLTGKALHELIRLSPDATDLLKSVFDSLGLTGRSYDKILKLALTIADLADSDTVEAFHIAEAIQYRSLDRSDD